jgi:hypothetical protein
MVQPLPVQSSAQPQPKNKRIGVLAAAILGAFVLIAAMLLNGRAIGQYLFGYGDIYRFLLYHTKWSEEAVQGTALLIWGSYTVAFTVLSYSAIGRVFVGRPTWRVATIGLLAIVAQVPLLFFQAWLHESPTSITDLKDLQCFDTRTRGRVMVWYFKDRDGAITLFENGYGGTWRGQELQPATQDICDLAQARWKASENEAQAKEAAKKVMAAELEKKQAALEKTHNFEDGKITMRWKAYVFPFASEDYSIGMKLIAMRTIHQPEGQKANVELALNVCNTGQQGIAERQLHIWYVPDEKSRTVRWHYTLNDLPTGGCARYSALAGIDDIASLSMLAGTLYFSDTSERHLTSTHIADMPVGNAKKTPDLANYAPGAPAAPSGQSDRSIPAAFPLSVPPGARPGFPPARIPSFFQEPVTYPYELVPVTSAFELPNEIDINYGRTITIGGNETYVAGRTPVHWRLKATKGAIVITTKSNRKIFVHSGQWAELYDFETVDCIASCPARFYTYR